MSNKIYYVALVFLIAVFLMLFLQIMPLMNHTSLGVLFFSQLTNIFAGYFMLGIGIGLPMVLLAGTLSWLQILLLLGGQIDPHLGREGFVKVLKTLFNKF